MEWYISPLRNFIIQWFKNKVWSSGFFFFPDKQSGLNREAAWTGCSELYLPSFFPLKTHPFLLSLVQLSSTNRLHSREMTFKCENEEGKSCSFWLSTMVPAAGGSTETKSMTFFFILNHFIWESHIIARLKSHYFNLVWPPAENVRRLFFVSVRTWTLLSNISEKVQPTSQFWWSEFSS